MEFEKLLYNLRKTRSGFLRKKLSKDIIYNFLELFDKKVDLKIIKKYFDLKNGPIYLSDFISILMLLHHHKHIDIKLGFYLELNFFFREILHNLFLSNMEIKKIINYQKKIKFWKLKL